MQLLLFRTLENTRGVTISGEQLAEEVYPSVVFFQDTYQLNIDEFSWRASGIWRRRSRAGRSNRRRSEELVANSQLGWSWNSVPTMENGGGRGGVAFLTCVLDINLATHPYEDQRRFWMRWGSRLWRFRLDDAGAAVRGDLGIGRCPPKDRDLINQARTADCRARSGESTSRSHTQHARESQHPRLIEIPQRSVSAQVFFVDSRV